MTTKGAPSRQVMAILGNKVMHFLDAQRCRLAQK